MSGAHYLLVPAARKLAPPAARIAVRISVTKCRYVLWIKAVFETDAAPKIGELDSESAAQEIFRGLVEFA